MLSLVSHFSLQRTEEEKKADEVDTGIAGARTPRYTDGFSFLKHELDALDHTVTMIDLTLM